MVSVDPARTLGVLAELAHISAFVLERARVSVSVHECRLFMAATHHQTSTLTFAYNCLLRACECMGEVFKSPLKENEIGAIVTPCLRVRGHTPYLSCHVRAAPEYITFFATHPHLLVIRASHIVDIIFLSPFCRAVSTNSFSSSALLEFIRARCA